ncbi:hypothetical protein [Marinomonas balearica]|uniref:Uncharacterized protein n=1 Tax=Marinomonas balearica TaxID=491947 RepID=A0A4R6M8C7_9GAMM|nr:hypothetical protein [Marinomonas balearica]TDO97604.1 hypothetical protein DFP79_2427 [Marinomonas balearica]
MAIDAISNQVISQVASPKSVATGTDASIDTDSPIPNTPDVQVSLSDTARQLALETQQRTTIFESSASDPSQAQNEQRDLAAANQAELREVSSATTSAEATPTIVEEEEAETAEQIIAAPALEQPNSVNTETSQLDDSDDTQTLAAANIANQTSFSANSNQGTSLATQYNISPEAALGQTISVGA